MPICPSCVYEHPISTDVYHCSQILLGYLSIVSTKVGLIIYRRKSVTIFNTSSNFTRINKHPHISTLVHKYRLTFIMVCKLSFNAYKPKYIYSYINHGDSPSPQLTQKS